MNDFEVVPEVAVPDVPEPVVEPPAPEPEPEPIQVPEAPVIVPEPIPQDPEVALIPTIKANPGMCAEELVQYFPGFSVEEIHAFRKKYLGVRDTVHI